MSLIRLPHVLVMALAAVAVAHPAAALPPSTAPEPVRVELVGDAELAGLTGKFIGSNMLVGVRVDLVSTLATPQGGRATAAGSLYIRRSGNGFIVAVDSHAGATAGEGEAPAITGIATGGERVTVNGIGQITQIAGDGNRMSNLAVVRFVDSMDRPSGFNGQTGQQAEAGGLTARVSFTGGGVQLGLTAPGATIGQQALTGGAGGVMQVGRIAGDGMVASNALHMQVLATAMPSLSLQQLGVQQALAAITGLRR